jgi:hypothetical protein
LDSYYAGVHDWWYLLAFGSSSYAGLLIVCAFLYKLHFAYYTLTGFFALGCVPVGKRLALWDSYYAGVHDWLYLLAFRSSSYAGLLIIYSFLLQAYFGPASAFIFLFEGR